MLEFIIFLLAAIGLTTILTQSSLFKFLQKRFKLFRCSMCCGLYSGCIIWFLQNLTLDIEIILYGFIGSYVCFLSSLIIKKYFGNYF